MDLKRNQEAQSHYDAGTIILNNLHNYLSIHNDLEEAVKHLQKATELNPNFAFAFHNLAHAWYQIAEYNYASAQLQKFKVEPQEVEVNIQGALEYALDAVDKTIVLQQIFPQAHNTRAMILAKLFRLDEALAEINIALSQNLGYENAINNGQKIEELIKERARTPGYTNEKDFISNINKGVKDASELRKKLWR